MKRPWFSPALLLVLGLAVAAASVADGLVRQPSAEGARVYIIDPSDRESVSSPITIRFGLTGMGVAPAGVDRPNTGHHHLLIDTDLPAMDQPIPADDQHRHFGGGQTEATLELAPGSHKLQLVFADFRHVPHDPPLVSEPVSITVR